MEDGLTIISIGTHTRLHEFLSDELEGKKVRIIRPDAIADADLTNQRVLFAISLNAYGMANGLDKIQLRLRSDLNAMEGSYGAVIVDGDTELYTKAVARSLIFDANRSGCAFPAKSLVEATKWLRNYHVISKVSNIDYPTAYLRAARGLVERLLVYEPQLFVRPRVLLLHASSRSSSNTLSLGIEVTRRLKSSCDISEIAMFNGPVYDCNGCSYKACSHFASQKTCFYGGLIPDQVFPAIEQCDAIILCCPNYNDAPGAHFLALNNRLNALSFRDPSHEWALFAIVVSGYSGGNLVAEQLLGGYSLNKPLCLPPRFVLLETANDPGAIMRDDGIHERLEAFAENIRVSLCATI